MLTAAGAVLAAGRSGATVAFGGRQLPKALATLLNAQGRADLAHPQPGWTLGQARDDLERILGEQILSQT